jgi:hypothetical protein
MFPSTQRLLLLKLNDRAVLIPADYSFPVPGQSGTRAAHLRLGDLVYDHENQLVGITDITDLGEQFFCYYLHADEPPYYRAMQVLQGTVVATAEGYKRIEQLRSGDRILSDADDAPHWTTIPWMR